MNTKITGNKGEELACQFLEKEGYCILQRNWRTRTGEIDIITIKDDVVVFVEVKTMPNATADMLLKVLNTDKQQRIVKTAKRFLIKYRQYSNSYLRFDVIVIGMQGLPPVYHIENAFSEN